MGVEVGPVAYATTADGVTIAYQSVGSGPTLLRLPTESNSMRFYSDLTSATAIAWAEALRTVNFDPRGIGMSDRDHRDFSLEACVADAVAVAEALGSPVPVFASQLQVPTALRLAAERPDLVSKLVLTAVYGADNRGLSDSPLMHASTALLDADWDTWKQYIARVVARREGAEADRYVDQLEEEIGKEAIRAQLVALYAHDATACVPSLDVPTLFVEAPTTPQRRVFGMGARGLARQIAGARLVRSVGSRQTIDLIREYVSETDDEGAQGAIRTILFTDLVSSTALTQQVGDAAAQQIVEAHDVAVRDALKAHHGVEIKHTGDGIMAAFDSATNAARAARQVIGALSARDVGVRIGLNAGEPIQRDRDLFGTAVQLAARVGDAAAEGQALATQVVRDLTAGKGLNWTPAPPVHAKGFQEPIAVYSLDTD